MDHNSTQRWSPHIKRTVALILLILVVMIIYRFQVIIAPLVFAFLIAFILAPIVDSLTKRTRLSRGLATALVFVVLILIGLALVAAPVAIIPSPQEIASTVQKVLDDTLASINAFLERPLEIGEYELDLSGVYEELSNSVLLSEEDAYCSYLYRQLDETTRGKLDNLGINSLGHPAEALALDVNSLGGPKRRTNHRARWVNVVYRDTHAQAFRNPEALFALRDQDYAAFPTSVDRRLDEILCAADFALRGNSEDTPPLP